MKEKQRGFLTVAQNGKDNYLRMAYALALSLKATQTSVSDLSVMVTPGMTIPDKYKQVFDQIIEIPWMDEAKHSRWKLENEWKTYHVSPYIETVKLDADMLFTSDIGAWWPLLEKQDILACTTVETYRGEAITSDFYRKCFTANNLPNIYTGFMYFKFGEEALALFDLITEIYHHWRDFFREHLEPLTRPQYVSTDVVFALAIKLFDADRCTFPSLPVPRFVHMKTRLQNWPQMIEGDEDWTKHVQTTLTDDLVLKIGRYQQYLPVHYQLKSFLTDEIIAKYERKLGL
jgi:hypothetical protein